MIILNGETLPDCTADLLNAELKNERRNVDEKYCTSQTVQSLYTGKLRIHVDIQNNI